MMLNNYFNNFKDLEINFDFIVHDPNIGILESDLKEKGCSIFHVTPKKKSIFKNAKEIENIILKGNYDIIHAHQNLSSFVPLMLAKKIGVKIRIAHSHVGYINEKKITKLLNYSYKKLTNYYSTHKFACSQLASNWLFGKKKEKEVYIIKNAININEFKFNLDIRKKIRYEQGWEDKFIVGNVARFFPEKNHDFLIEIFAEIKKKKENSVLVLVGEEDDQKLIREIIEQKKMRNSIRILGVREDISELMQGMDVFILPSKFEGLGMVLIEAQATGLKCFASTAVPMETKITDLIEYIPLKKSAEYWAEKIINNAQIIDREEIMKEEFPNEYDITKEALKLEALYRKFLIEIK